MQSKFVFFFCLHKVWLLCRYLGISTLVTKASFWNLGQVYKLKSMYDPFHLPSVFCF